jgi:hypothetical protein
MLLGGLWHGAAWLFVIWGAWHGIMLAGYHVLKGRGWWVSNGSRIGWWFNRQLTFIGVVIGWVLFRAADIQGHGYGWASITPAFKLLAQMAGASRGRSPAVDVGAATVSPLLAALLPLCWAWCNFVPNSFEVAYGRSLHRRHAAVAGLILGVCMLSMGARMDFLYFRF